MPRLKKNVAPLFERATDSLMIAALAMSLSSASIIFNALRLLRARV